MNRHRDRRNAGFVTALEAMAADPTLGDEGRRIATEQLRRFRARSGIATPNPAKGHRPMNSEPTTSGAGNTAPIEGGATEVECTVCTWTIPGELHEGHGTPERPAGADYADAALPLIGAHIADTGHRVRVTSTTTHADGLVEQSAQLISPRTTPKENR